MNTFTCEGVEKCWYMYYYFKYGTTHDYLSYQIMDFKADKEKQLHVFAELSAEAVKNLGKSFDYVVRALGSDELEPKSSRVVPVAKGIAEAISAKYIPYLLMKTRATQPLKGMNRAQRVAELEGAYAINREYNLNNKRVLIVDDITTTGTTIEAISNVIKSKYPEAKTYGFCIAHTKHPDWDDVSENETAWVEEYKEAFKK